VLQDISGGFIDLHMPPDITGIMIGHVSGKSIPEMELPLTDQPLEVFDGMEYLDVEVGMLRVNPFEGPVTAGAGGHNGLGVEFGKSLQVTLHGVPEMRCSY
jgi:hypothetical protein